MKRRDVLSIGAVGLGALAGCGGRRRSENDEIHPLLKLYPTLGRENGDWSVKVRAKNTRVQDAPIHEVTVLAFKDTGEELCRNHVGDLDSLGSNERTVHLSCEAFPAIITAIAEESPCDGARISLLYYVGDREARKAGKVNDASLWEQTRRQCNEELPPERVLENVSPGE